MHSNLRAQCSGRILKATGIVICALSVSNILSQPPQCICSTDFVDDLQGDPDSSPIVGTMPCLELDACF
jgi:hypothetical protein